MIGIQPGFFRDSRQLAIVLQLILELGQYFNDGLALVPLFLFVAGYDSTMNVINGSRLDSAIRTGATPQVD